MIHVADELLKDLRKGNLSPVYFAFGDEPYYLDEIGAYLENQVIPDEQKDFGMHIFYGKEAKIAEILSVARSFPMMIERQVVLVKEAQELQGLNKEENRKLLEGYLENPQPTTILAFIHKHKKFDKRTTLAKKLEKMAVMVESKKIYDNQLPKWIENQLHTMGLQADTDAIQMLSENIGNNLERLANELKKLKLNIQEGQRVDKLAVDRYIGISKDYNIFELQRSLGIRDAKKCFQIVRYFAQNPKEHPVLPAISVLYNWVTKLLVIKSLSLSNDRDVAQRTGISPYIARDYLSAARNYNVMQLEYAVNALFEADMKIKGLKGISYRDEDIWRDLIVGFLA